MTAVASPSFAFQPPEPRPRRFFSVACVLSLALSALTTGAACQGSILTESGDAGQKGSGSASGDDSSADGTTSANTTTKCGPAPTSLVSSKDLFSLAPGGLSAAMDLAVNATDLYVAVNSNPTATILRVPLGGRSMAALATVEGNEQALVLTSTYVVFAESHTASNNGSAVGSSRVDLQACKLEYSIVSPK